MVLSDNPKANMILIRAAFPPFAAFLLTLLATLPNTGCSPGPPSHGTAFLILVGTNQPKPESDSESVLAQTREVLRKRAEKAGFGSPFFQTTNGGQLMILLSSRIEASIPDLGRLIERPGVLEFRMVHPESDELLRDNIIEPGYEILGDPKPRSLPDGSKSFQRFLVSRTPAMGMIGEKKLAMTGNYLKKVIVSRDPVTRQPEIDFELNAQGAEIFRQITREFSPRRKKYYQLAIVLDGVLYSAPRILGEIPNGRARITGNFSPQEAIELATILEDPLPTPVKIIEVKQY